MEILGKNFKVNYGLRAMFVFEQITERPFAVNGLMDEYILFYSCIVSVKDNPALDFEEFIDYCNDHPELLEDFGKYLQDELKKKDAFDKKKVVKEQN